MLFSLCMTFQYCYLIHSINGNESVFQKNKLIPFYYYFVYTICTQNTILCAILQLYDCVLFYCVQVHVDDGIESFVSITIQTAKLDVTERLIDYICKGAFHRKICNAEATKSIYDLNNIVLIQKKKRWKAEKMNKVVEWKNTMIQNY